MLWALLLMSIVGGCSIAAMMPAARMPTTVVTSLMSGVIIVGAIIAVAESSDTVAPHLGLAAIFLSAVAIVGGFVAARRMTPQDDEGPGE